MSTFTDKVTITVESGHGGPGCVSFRREKYEPKGGPNGGNGGRGGSIFLKVSQQVQSLSDFKYKKIFKAKNGSQGKPKQQSGLDAENIYLSVPIGTMVYDENKALICDLNEPESEFCLAKGGLGGKGNMNFATSVNQAPRYAQSGLPGETVSVTLELRMIADVGLIGFPNAGKSTLLKTLTYSNPKIANYPFTTLTPNLGTLKLIDKEIIIADIPGLIKGASEGHGLGDEFLRHIDRTSLLVHLICAEESAEYCLEKFITIQEELSKSKYELMKKPNIIVISKVDSVNTEKLKEIIQLFNEIDKKPITISSFTGEGIDCLMQNILKKIN